MHPAPPVTKPAHNPLLEALYDTASSSPYSHSSSTVAATALLLLLLLLLLRLPPERLLLRLPQRLLVLFPREEAVEQVEQPLAGAHVVQAQGGAVADAAQLGPHDLQASQQQPTQCTPP